MHLPSSDSKTNKSLPSALLIFNKIKNTQHNSEKTMPKEDKKSPVSKLDHYCPSNYCCITTTLSSYLTILLVVLLNVILQCESRYLGRYIGAFPIGSIHNVKGIAFAANDRQIFIQGFNYDGTGPDAFFWAGTSGGPSPNGFMIPDELGRTIKLGPYQNQDVLLTLPQGRTIRDIKWISIWCRLFQANFGHITIPLNFEPPIPVNLGPLPSFAHKTRADSVMIEDTKTLRIRNLFYDGAAPDAFFLVGTGTNPHSRGTKVPDENGSLTKLKGYNGKDIVLRLPSNLTVNDIDWFGLYCITYEENFGHVRIPRNANVPADTKMIMTAVSSFSNCETIFPEILQMGANNKQMSTEGALQVSWEVRQPDIYIQLEARVNPDRYVSFGISGDLGSTQMIGSDVVLAYFDSKSRRVNLVDYILMDKSQCNPQTGSGSCPDNLVRGGRQDSELISSSYIDGVLKVIYRRKLDTGDDVADRIIDLIRPVVVVAAIGNLNSHKEAGYHSVAVTSARQAPIEIHFGRMMTMRNCKPMLQSTSMSHLLNMPGMSPSMGGSTTAMSTITNNNANTASTALMATANLMANSNVPNRQAIQSTWSQPVISETNIFRVVIGPSGGERGYTALTGIQSWGIAYWINNKLIPVLRVKRGQNYTFIVQTGKNPQRQAKYHPLYITNHPEGGGGQRPDELRSSTHQVYAGIKFIPGRPPDASVGAGRYCELEAKDIDRASESDSVDSYRDTLVERCEDGSPARFTWTPDDSTPDVVYYQCFTHRNLGWKILVSSGALSMIQVSNNTSALWLLTSLVVIILNGYVFKAVT